MEQGDFIDNTGYTGKQISSPKELVLQHMAKMSASIFAGNAEPILRSDSRGQELIKGADKRETFILASDFLYSLLQPYYDSTMQEKQKNFNEALRNREQELITSTINNQAFEISRDKGYDDHAGAYAYWKQELSRDRVIRLEKTSANFEYYLETKYKMYLKLFQELQFLLYRKKWLALSDYHEDAEEDEE